MKKQIAFLLLIALVSCKSEPALDITEEEIDTYVESRLDPSLIYDISQSPRFSREDESYQVNQYELYDTIVLLTSEENTTTNFDQINIFYKDKLPVFIEHFSAEFNENSSSYSERKIYLNGREVIKAYERTAVSEFEIEEVEFAAFDVALSDYDLDKPEKAVKQEGDFEMKYGEFLIINPESYLVLENEKSGYGVALYIMDGDMLLDELFAKPNDYRGKTIFVYHEFRVMEGVERMIYKGGIVKVPEE
jgi:hypothetical protein